MNPGAAVNNQIAAAAGSIGVLQCAVSEDKGCRPEMEDAWVCQMDAGSSAMTGSLRVSFFGVFDGHGGRSCAQYVADHLNGKVLEAGLVPQAGAGLVAEAAGEGKLDIKAAKGAITEGFESLDAELVELCKTRGWQDGAAVVAVWVVGQTVLVANAGDAKAVLARHPPDDQSSLRAITLTKDHLAIYPAERARIIKAGGTVSKDGRLNGRIQISRSLGDAAFKSCGASPVPDIAAFSLTDRDQFLLLGCDGFWGVFDAQSAVDAAAAALKEGRDAKGATNKLLLEAIRERRCKDNCTVMMIRFLEPLRQQQQEQQQQEQQQQQHKTKPPSEAAAETAGPGVLDPAQAAAGSQ